MSRQPRNIEDINNKYVMLRVPKDTYIEIRNIKSKQEKQIGIKLTVPQTLTLILNNYVSNNRNK